jgi:hypothetical protein
MRDFCERDIGRFRQNVRVQERLSALANRLEAIAWRIRALGLTRAAEDLVKVSADLRQLGGGAEQKRAA